MSARYFLKRLGFALITLVLSSVLTFCLVRAMPGDIFEVKARELSKSRGIDIDEAKRIVSAMVNYNPEEPLPSQLKRYYSGLLHGNLGTSFYQDKSVNELVAYALPWTLFVVTISLFVCFLLGTRMGGLMAWNRRSIVNPIVTIYATVTSAVPFFIFAVLFQMVFCFTLGWLPINGAYNIYTTPGFNLPFIASVLLHAISPITVYILTSLGGWALSMKGSSVNVLGEDYINAAHARGIPPSIIRKRYMMKNAMLPLITNLALTFGTMFGGAVLIERTFVYPGMGTFLNRATDNRDFPVTQGMLLVISLAVIIANILSELLYSKLDPRIKREE
ncbi:peptide ABC transporter permease [Clostridia bacterium]|nr:peptide ABC transporter permease [Clostridia bacterium]